MQEEREGDYEDNLGIIKSVNETEKETGVWELWCRYEKREFMGEGGREEGNEEGVNIQYTSCILGLYHSRSTEQ